MTASAAPKTPCPPNFTDGALLLLLPLLLLLLLLPVAGVELEDELPLVGLPEPVVLEPEVLDEDEPDELVAAETGILEIVVHVPPKILQYLARQVHSIVVNSLTAGCSVWVIGQEGDGASSIELHQGGSGCIVRSQRIRLGRSSQGLGGVGLCHWLSSQAFVGFIMRTLPQH